MNGIVFLGWQDNDKNYPTHRKLADAIERHEEKHGVRPNICLTSEQDAAELADTDLGIQIEGRGYIARGTMYVGLMCTAAPEARQGVLL